MCVTITLHYYMGHAAGLLLIGSGDNRQVRTPAFGSNVMPR